ncbi:MAG: aspartyl-phosphate phosphatase Spo0E family protein [Thermincola sp.]|jgi:hypothetical protein|nr:aspartyl-phosphate phosphatase Spo0E family protein [Thermincola sp.]MDT3702752.1 aspartyl-phosphate phosphatase Spo0E family protein [Thermincola sp.]
MWRTRRDFKKRIREKQKEMYLLVRTKGMGDPDVYDKSCELDCLINEYMKRYNNYVYGNLFNKY